MAPVRAEAVGREMPVVGAGVAFFAALADGSTVFAQDEGLLSPPQRSDRIGLVQVHAVVRHIRLMDDFCIRVSAADLLGKQVSAGRRPAVLREDDPPRSEIRGSARLVGNIRPSGKEIWHWPTLVCNRAEEGGLTHTLHPAGRQVEFLEEFPTAFHGEGLAKGEASSVTSAGEEGHGSPVAGFPQSGRCAAQRENVPVRFRGSGS